MTNNNSLAKSLTLFQVVFMGLAWMTPMIFFTVYGVAFQASDGMLAASYVVAFTAIFFTAYSYSRMAKAFPISGSAYTFSKKAINPQVGFFVGWALLLDYIFSPIIALLTFGIFLNAQFPNIPAFVFIILLNIILAFVNIIGIKSAANVSRFSVIFQIIFIAFFCVLVIQDILSGSGEATLFSFTPFFNPDLTVSTVFAGAALICFCFLGFDAVTTMAEETINPKKTIPRAIFIIIGIAIALYLSISYLTKVAYPNFSFTNSDTAAMELVQLVGGNLLNSLFITVLIVAIFTQGVSSMTSVSRLLYAMGRENTLPKIFGSVHPKYKTPVFNILFVAIVSLIALVIKLDTAVMFVSFGALTAFTFVNLSVIGHYYVKERKRSFKQTLLYLVFPLIGAGFIGWLLTMLETNTLIAGSIWLAFGFVYLLFLTKMFSKPLPEYTAKKEIA